MAEYHGGCLCGATRWVARDEPATVVLCHCSMCRRASGAPAVAWAMWPLDRFAWTRGKPAIYASSQGVERGFCASCGTPLSFGADFLPGLIDVTVGSLDAPESLPPRMHIWDADRLAWLALADDWPRHRELPPRAGA